MALAGGVYTYYTLNQDSESNPVLIPASESNIAHVISLGTTPVEIPKEGVQENPVQPLAKKEAIKHQKNYNEKALDGFKDRINTVITKFTVDGKPDGWFGPKTMESLEGMVADKPATPATAPDQTSTTQVPPAIIEPQPSSAPDTRTDRQKLREQIDTNQKLIDAMKLLTYYVANDKLEAITPPRTAEQEKAVIIASINILNTYKNTGVTLFNTDYSGVLKDRSIDAMKTYNLPELEKGRTELQKQLNTTPETPEDRKNNTINNILALKSAYRREDLQAQTQEQLDKIYQEVVVINNK